ncbi:MAG TPA: hypothetical protein VD789_08355 [Thermomicrobiales bacterium]|nr:hypothetical protein [Thermomicrobiales bacterium]
MTGTRHRFRVEVATLVALLASVLLASATVQGVAQESATCTLEPISLPLFDATPAAVIVGTPAATTDRPEPTEEEMTAAAEELIVCTNETSQAARYAIFTERLLALQFASDAPAYQPAFERMIATGETPDPGSNELVRISAIEPLEDGRVAVTLHISTPEGDFADRLVLAWDPEQGAWLIDGVASLRGEGTPAG